MLPRIVLHKRNGHSHVPAKSDVTPDRVLLMVHAPPWERGGPARDLLRFAALVRSEKPRAFVEQAARRIDGLRLFISEALARTRAAFDRGDLSDVRSAIESIRAQSDAAASIVRALIGTLPPGDAERVVVDLSMLLEGVLGPLRLRLQGRLPVEPHLEPGLPRVLGSPTHLQQALATFVGFVADDITSSGTSGRLLLEIVRGGSTDHAPRLVEVHIRAEGASSPDAADTEGEPIDVGREAGLALACHVLSAHRGAVSARRFGPGRVAVVLELPAV